MERLTEKRDGQNVIPLRQNGKVKWSICSAGLGDAPTEYLYGEHADRLAAYEDTGLEPEEIISAVDMEKVACALHELNAYKELGPIDRLHELAQADREGKIPKYTIGDTIYDRFGDAWEVTAVERLLLAGEPKWIYRCGHIGTNDYFALWEFEVLTRAEAEAALQGEREEKQ